MSTPSSPTYKDGMFRYLAKRRRQPRWVRILVAVGIVSFLYLFIARTTSTPGVSIASRPPAASRSKGRPVNADDLGFNAHGKAKAPQLPITDDDEDDRSARRGRSRGRKRPSKDDDDDKPQASRADRAPLIADEDAEDVEKDDATLKLEADLRHIFTIAPDELHVRELLRPIENSGKERLRELGLRARAFRTLLESWEEIHLIKTKNTTVIRDDIITYLRRTKDLSGISSSKTRADVIRSYEQFRYFLTKLSALLFPWTAPYFADHMTLHASIKHGGRGIVLSGGDGQLSYLMTSARAIRKLGCNLPIEVMYLGDDDLGDDARSELETLPNVITRDMKQMVHDEGWDIKGWAGKPFAILLSSFREVIFIDADAQFFQSPEVLFEDEAYDETGALFFRDRLMFPESKRKWLQQILPKPMSRKVRQSRFWTGESGHMQESGVVVVDKWRHFMALLMVTRMNGPDRDGDKDKGIVGTYDMVYGDKETFWLGWELVGDTDYAFHPGDAGNMGVAQQGNIKDRPEDDSKDDDEEDNSQDDEAQRKQAKENMERAIEEAKAKQAEKDAGAKEAEKKDPEAAAGAKEASDAEGFKLLQPADAAPVQRLAKRQTKKKATNPLEDDDPLDENDPMFGYDTPSPARTNYTICAPQLLHLSRDGKPLWFNGWILDNKFDGDNARLSKFDVYMREKKRGAKIAEWRLEKNNMCCLESDETHKFTKAERAVLNNIVEIAKDVGAIKHL